MSLCVALTLSALCVIIPALLLSNKGFYKTVNFKSKQYIGDPLNIIKIFNDKFADEIMIFDIDASKNKKIDFEYLRNIFQRNQAKVTKLINDIVRISVIEEEIEYYKTLIRDTDTGHIHTTIGFLNRRIKELKGEAPWQLD